uniref:Myc box-dependent-interacting protein 1 n=1 Tax=Labrus bergylta TaxID=56723 RepID=A0A3Q3EBN4_9LABR
MAELNLGKGLTAGKVASNVQKKLTRAQEKVLQKLGKADETKDVAFEEGVINFNKQYTEGSKLQRDLRAYLEAVKAMHESSKNVQACLADMYEPEWDGSREVESIVEDCDVLWEDYHQKLVDHALISMDTYLGQFPDIKARIAKRDRKLVDYDSARHNYATTHKTKKKDGGIKLTKPSSLLERATPGWAQVSCLHTMSPRAEEELERAQKVFEEINIDLQEELPSLWNSRVGFYVSTFQSLAGFEEKFHKEIGRVRLGLPFLTFSRTFSHTFCSSSHFGCNLSVFFRFYPHLCLSNSLSGKEASNHTLRPGGPPPIPKSPSKVNTNTDACSANNTNYSLIVNVISGNVTLYLSGEQNLQVMHDYAANDTDELEMKAGDVVLVIPFDNAEEQDDGWLMGMKEDDWHQNKENAAKGVFPENFTQRL